MGRRTAVYDDGEVQEPGTTSSVPLLEEAVTRENLEKPEDPVRLGTVRNFDQVGRSKRGWTSSSVHHLMTMAVIMMVTVGAGGLEAEVEIEQVNSCKAFINGFVYNLEPLMRKDGHPRFVAEDDSGLWKYSFNPCLSFNVPVDPHEGTGDQCHYVAVCQWHRTESMGEYFSLGIQRNAKFTLLQHPVAFPFQNNLPSSASNQPDLISVKNESGKTTDSNSTAIYSSLRDTASLADLGNVAVTEPATVIAKAANSSANIANAEDTMRRTASINDSASSGFSGSFDGFDLRRRIHDESKTNRSDEPWSTEIVYSKNEYGKIVDDLEAAPEKHGRRKEGERKDKINEEKQESKSTALPVTISRIDAATETIDRRETRVSGKAIEIQDNAATGAQHHQPIDSLHKRIPTIVFRGIRTKTRRKVYIYLVCDYDITKVDDAVLRYLNVASHDKHFELRHRCCCPNGCTEDWPRADYLLDERQQTKVRGSILTTAADFHPINRSEPSIDLAVAEAKHPLPSRAVPDNKPKYIWLVLVINVAILAAAVFVAGVCCKKGGISFVSTGAYGYVPTAMHSSRLTMDSSDLDGRYVSTVKLSSPDYRDYGSPGQQGRAPVLGNCVIPRHQVEIGQRLGGGLFSDTYLAEWKKRRVAVRRITVRVHQNQMTEADFGWIVLEILRLSHQRHRNLVAVLGICVETRQPYVITELIEGDSLKEKINSMEIEQYNWYQRIKHCIQAADGMAFLHSAKPPILHRDLRCANILIDQYGKAKVVDFGLTRIVQRLRNECDHGTGCYCQKERSAYPASVRWTAPEILRSPVAQEEEGKDREVFSTACDVYSFAMACWEIASYRDPFEESTEDQVIDLVLQGMRPPVDSLLTILPPFRELMKACWTQTPDTRPTFKQIAVTLKSIQQVCGRFLSQMKRKHNNSESSSRDTTTTNYLRSALNLSEI